MNKIDIGMLYLEADYFTCIIYNKTELHSKNQLIYFMRMKLQFAVFLLFITSYLFSGQSESLFDSVSSYLKRYRQNIEEKDLTIKNGVIYLELYGRRTNLNSLLLLGFYSVGRQLQNNNYPFREVQIIIHYEMKDTQQIVVSATVESVLSLSQGRINPDQFYDEVHR